MWKAYTLTPNHRNKRTNKHTFIQLSWMGQYLYNNRIHFFFFLKKERKHIYSNQDILSGLLFLGNKTMGWFFKTNEWGVHKPGNMKCYVFDFVTVIFLDLCFSHTKKNTKTNKHIFSLKLILIVFFFEWIGKTKNWQHVNRNDQLIFDLMTDLNFKLFFFYF